MSASLDREGMGTSSRASIRKRARGAWDLISLGAIAATHQQAPLRPSPVNTKLGEDGPTRSTRELGECPRLMHLVLAWNVCWEHNPARDLSNGEAVWCRGVQTAVVDKVIGTPGT